MLSFQKQLCLPCRVKTAITLAGVSKLAALRDMRRLYSPAGSSEHKVMDDGADAGHSWPCVGGTCHHHVFI